MDAKLMLLCATVLLVLVFHDVVLADFLYNRVLPKQDKLKGLGLKCIPGRTTIKIQEKPIMLEAKQSGSDEDDDSRRSHMRFQTNEEYCQVCVCSVDGKDEYCSKRPAMNVNECMMLAKVMERFHSNEPYDHERTLAYMIRRAYVWHDDELPRPENAKCKRGHSYYSNSLTANDTDVDVSSDVTSLLDYSNKSVCFFCVCSLSGTDVGCLPRKPWFCQYYRNNRKPNSIRNKYIKLFGQDRPSYFTMISHRLRRTMDDGMFDLVENGGDTLCCGHSDGHRRQLHHQVRTKLRLLRNKANKENLMSGSPGGDYVDFIVNND